MTNNEKELKKIEVFFNYVTGVAFKRAFKSAAREVGMELVNRTPVYFEDLPTSGNHKGNWRVTTDGTVDTTYEPGEADITGMKTLSDLNGIIHTASLKEDSVITFSNSGPGIMALEYGFYPLSPKVGSVHPVTGKAEIRSQGGYSKNAPLGIVGIVALEWQDIVQGAVQRSVK